MTKKTVIKPAISQKFQEFLKNERILFFSAPCGFGKTAVAQALLEGRRVWKLEGESARGADLETKKDWDILLLEDFQLFQEEEDQQALCALIRRSPGKRFVILSRGSPPGCLMAFQYAGLMTVIGPKDLLFDREDIRQLFNASGIPVTDGELAGILKESIGYPLGVAITAQNMSSGARFSQQIVGRSYQEVYRYFETAIYQRLDLPYRRFLLELSPFESFNLEMARMVSGDAHAGEMLDWLQRYTTMLLYDGFRQYRFWPKFREFLLWEMDHSYPPEKRKALFNRGGLYFELKEDYSHALDCYTQGEDHAKVSEILIRNAELHPGMGHYSQMEKYYRSLPESEIRASPSLMQGMSMLCALSMDYVGSEGWYKKLKDFARQCDPHDAAGKQARSRLAWLDISLPQRKVDNLTETIPAVFRLMTNKEVHLPPFSVTSALPSIMNGGKDFSPWSKRDDLLYKTIRIPVEAVLGKDGVCLGDCAIAESKFEKGEDIGGRMLSLVSRMSEIQQNGTPDIEFAATGLLARNYLATGQPGNARRTLESLRARFADQGHSRFLPNIDAALCRVALHTGDLDSADAWYREKAPQGPHAPERDEALPVPDPGPGRAGRRDSRGGAADPGPPGPLLRKLLPVHRRHPCGCAHSPGPLPDAPGGLAGEADESHDHGGGIRLYPQPQRLRRGHSAPAGGASLDGQRPVVQAAPGRGPAAKRQRPPVFAATTGEKRCADHHGEADPAPDLRGQEQRRDCPDDGHQADHGEDPRQPYSGKTGREQTQRGQNRRQASEADPGGLNTPSSA